MNGARVFARLLVPLCAVAAVAGLWMVTAGAAIGPSEGCPPGVPCTVRGNAEVAAWGWLLIVAALALGIVAAMLAGKARKADAAAKEANPPSLSP